jgi:hypothetical protein
MVLMVESIYGQGFVYTREVEEDRQKKLVKLGLEKSYKRPHTRSRRLIKICQIRSNLILADIMLL